MKRVYALLLALLLLAGCGNQAETKDISVKDVCCPYEIRHSEDAVQVTLRDGTEGQLLWKTEAIPADALQVTQEYNKKEFSCRYRIEGLAQSVAQLTFTASRDDGTVDFELVLVVEVDPEGKAVVSSAEHRERVGDSAEENGLAYSWDVDVDGTLSFSFFNDEDRWSVRGDGENVCTLMDAMAIPGGCQFSARAIAPGQTTVELVGRETNKTVCVVIRVDDSGKVSIESVQER